MAGTPEKILEHLLETVKLDSNGDDAIGENLQAPTCLFFFFFRGQLVSESKNN